MLQGFEWEKLLTVFQDHPLKDMNNEICPILPMHCRTEEITKGKSLQGTSSRFEKCNWNSYLNIVEEDNYKQLSRRITAAVNYFAKEIEEKLAVC